MLSIRPGFGLDAVLGYLDFAIEGARKVEQDLGNIETYFAWVAANLRTLGAAVTPSELDRLITTPTYWAIQGWPSSRGGRVGLLGHEIAQRRTDLEAERKELAWIIDDNRRNRMKSVAVLDTNVVMEHHSDFAGLAWHSIVQVFPHDTVRVVIPILVIDELDKLKRSQGSVTKGGKTSPRRSVARQALRSLSRMFQSPEMIIPIDRRDKDGFTEPATLELLMDPPGHVRLDNPDAEIRDRALSFGAYVASTTLVTYDLGNQFAAQLVGLNTHRLTDEEDEALKEGAS